MPFINPSFVFNLSKQIGTKHFFTGHLVYLIHYCKTVIQVLSMYTYQPIRCRPENAALFLRLGLPFTLIRHENGACEERSSKRMNFKTRTLRVRVDEKHSGKGALRKQCHLGDHVISQPQFSSNKSKKDR